MPRPRIDAGPPMARGLGAPHRTSYRRTRAGTHTESVTFENRTGPAGRKRRWPSKFPRTCIETIGNDEACDVRLYVPRSDPCNPYSFTNPLEMAKSKSMGPMKISNHQRVCAHTLVAVPMYIWCRVTVHKNQCKNVQHCQCRNWR